MNIKGMKKQQTWVAMVIGLCLLAWLPPSWAADAYEIRIGVLAKRGPQKALERWQATARYLSEKIPEHRFRIVPMQFEEAPILVEKELVDLTITNPAIYADLAVRFNVQRIVTLKNRLSSKQNITRFGSVIFTRKYNQNFRRIQDLANARLAAVHDTSLGGWIMALKTFQNHGLNRGDFSNVTFLNNHDPVVEGVLEGRFEAGVVRTGHLEKMVQEGRITLNQLQVIRPLKHEGFPLLVSTRLYPEWPVAKARHTDNRLALKVAMALMALTAEEPAALKAGIAGWSIPENYQSIHELLQDLQLPPYETFNTLSPGRVVHTYWYWMVLILFVVLIQTWLTRRVIKLNRALKSRQQKVQESEMRMRATFEQVASGIVLTHADGRLDRANHAFCAMTGYSAREIRQKNLNDFTDPLQMSQEIPLFEKMRQGALDHFTLQKQLLTKGGASLPVLFSISCVRDEKGDIQQLIGVANDLSSIKKLQQDVRSEQQLKTTILDIAGDGILGIDTQGCHSFVNPAASHILGWSVDELIGQPTHAMWHHHYKDGKPFPEQDCPITSVLTNGQTLRSTNAWLWRKDGSGFAAEYISTAIVEEDEITGAVVVFRAVTETQTQEEPTLMA
ncbi:PhnD/SsuA/transferrin family substrate-binding protein [Magnetococcus sp. PR-3]|uniref:PhnD/SsuA/transferrin family substrate-binding protein n=1 Tax=Magnetococcus sp. PR-3 TaxID=3120355 RepID=UPI002FCE3DAA